MTSGWLFAGFLVSTVGFGLFLYGKKEARWPQLVAGMTMMVYPGFVALGEHPKAASEEHLKTGQS